MHNSVLVQKWKTSRTARKKKQEIGKGIRLWEEKRLKTFHSLTHMKQKQCSKRRNWFISMNYQHDELTYHDHGTRLVKLELPYKKP